MDKRSFANGNGKPKPVVEFTDVTIPVVHWWTMA